MGVIILLITTFIWGTAFLAQKLCANHLGIFALTVLRNLLGGAFLLLLVAFRSKGGGTTRPPSGRSILAGIACGVPLFVAMAVQQAAIERTTPGICAFLTTNYVIFVPLIAAVLSRTRPAWSILGCALVALAGTCFICVPSGTGFQPGAGEALSVLCALCFAVQMIVVGRVAPTSDLLVMSASQLLTCCVLGAPFLFLESEAARLTASSLRSAVWPLVYIGVFSSGIAYTLQNLGQARTSASVAAVVLSFESVFGALSGWIVLGDRLTPLQLAGCGIVLAAVIAVQLPKRRENLNEAKQTALHAWTRRTSVATLLRKARFAWRIARRVKKKEFSLHYDTTRASRPRVFNGLH